MQLSRAHFSSVSHLKGGDITYPIFPGGLGTVLGLTYYILRYLLPLEFILTVVENTQN